MHKNLWKIKGVSSINIITFFFQRILCTGTQAFLNQSGKTFIGRDRSKVCTTSLILSDLANTHQCKAAFSGPYMRLYNGARPELYGGCGRISNSRGLIVSTVAAEEFGHASSWRKPLSFLRSANISFSIADVNHYIKKNHSSLL
jgi:hypothetical protein